MDNFVYNHKVGGKGKLVPFSESDQADYDARQPTPEQELQDKVESMTDAVQTHLDETAQSWGYDNIISLCTYDGNSDPKYSAEGAAGKEWRSSVWRYCEDELVKITAGDRLEPESNEAFIVELPTIVRPKL